MDPAIKPRVSGFSHFEGYKRALQIDPELSRLLTQIRSKFTQKNTLGNRGSPLINFSVPSPNQFGFLPLSHFSHTKIVDFEDLIFKLHPTVSLHIILSQSKEEKLNLNVIS